MELENQITQIIALDRLDIPVSSMSGKLKRQKKKLAPEVDLSEYDNEFYGERVYARIESDEKMTARGMREGIEKFSEEFPRHGKILEGYIQEQRAKRETRLYFGTNPGKRISSQDYVEVMQDLGFTENTAKNFYPELMEISRKLSRKREEERSILIK